MEFHVHTNASLLAVGPMLAQNPIRKYDQPIIYASRLLNKAKHDYTTTKKEALVMVYALYKFKHFLLNYFLQCTQNQYCNSDTLPSSLINSNVNLK
jgi:hypothetical protein